MRRDIWPTLVRRFANGRGPLWGLLAALAVIGCSRQPTTEVAQAPRPLTVKVTRPVTRDIVRFVGQPSFVESYERTSIYPKLSAYIKKWYVDIGDKVTRHQVLADLFVPEVEEDCQTKHDALEVAEERVKLAQEKVKVADANVQVAAAHLESAKKILDQYESQVARWAKEVDRLTRETKGKNVDARVLGESQSQLASSTAARDAALAEIERAEAELKSKTASLEQDDVAVEVAQAEVEVARHDYLRVKALVDWYLKLYAPFDGVIVARNANTWDFVLPATGDPTADHERTPDLSPGGKAAPVYVVDRTDVVRVFVDIPESDANFVHVGSKATVLAKAFRDQPIVGSVTRTSWALNVKSRTLRAEIDLPNTGSRIPDDLPKSTREALSQVRMPPADTELLPGMYAYGKVIIERPQVRALPAAALMHDGDQSFYFGYDDGKAVRTEIQTGVSDGKWIEVTNRRRKPAEDAGIRNVNFTATNQPARDLSTVLDEDGDWVPLDGSEQVIVGDLSILTDGAHVQVGSTEETEVASANAKAPGGKGNNLALATGS
ncbi:MAG TPA: efflux RND transporter periplasmic adaptor subunit [Pirellulales bacterium]|nr:efflux RND transporter periplasmic adaptor subunit [Pirellulales bacterium]